MKREVAVVSGVRTAIGKFGGNLKDVAVTEPYTSYAKIFVRPAVDGAKIGHVVGGVTQSVPKEMYPARAWATGASST